MTTIRVLKIGGNQLDDAAFVAGLAEHVARSASPPVIVHGGGRAIAETQARYGLEVVKVDGNRVTDAPTMKVVEMVLSGHVNKGLVAALTAAGVDALGLSGVDRGLLRGRLKQHPDADLGRVGTITSVRDSLLRELLDAGVVPVISPVTLAADGQACNVNADEAATAVALALGAASLDFVSNVPGVLDAAGERIETISPIEAGALIQDGIVVGGMVTKVRAALAAVAAGLARARIVDLAGLAEDGGTTLLGEASSDEVDDRPQKPSAEPVDADAIMAAEARHLMQIYARAPIVLSHGEGMSVWDTEGRCYLDFGSGIAVTALGHSDPGWVAAVTEQAGRLCHVSNLYHNEPMVALAERLTRFSFADRVYFCNSGAEANEAALKLARKWGRQTRTAGAAPRHRILAFEQGFHGRTAGALSMTANPAYREPFEPLVPLIAYLPYGDLEATRRAIDETVCAVIVEPIQGEGGVRPAPPGFLAGLREACDQAGALLIFDEVQSGMGRSGHLWAYEHYGVTPDLLSLAKPLAGGLPIGALLATEAAGQVLTPGDHGSTFAGGPLVCRAACEVVDRITASGFLENLRETSKHLGQRLLDLESPFIVDRRGLGLLAGLELDRPVAPLITAARERGLLVLGAGEKVLRLAPPLIASRENVDLALDILTTCLAEMD